MGFQRVISSGGIEEYSNIQNDLAIKSNYLETLYEEVQDKIKKFDKYEGYKEIDDIKEALVNMNKKVCNLSNDILTVNNNLTD